jgi:hypothetical protein
VLRLDAAAAHEAACDFARTPCPYAGCGALLRASEVVAHDAHAADAHAKAERAARLAALARADDLQRRLDKLAPYAVEAIDEMMDYDDHESAVESVVELFSLHASSAAVASKACDALALFTQCAFDAGDDSLAAELARVSGVDALVAALRTHGMHVPRVGEQACEALAKVMGFETMARKAAQEGVVAALLAALAAHEHNPSMQQAGLRLLTRLITPFEGSGDDVTGGPLVTDAAMRRTLMDAGAAARILAAMRAHLAYESLQYWAVKALCGLAPLDAAAAAGAITSLETVLAAHSSNTELLGPGFTLLRSCVTATNTQAASALACVAVTALRAAPADASLQQHGVAALEALCAAGHAAAVMAASAAPAPAAAGGGGADAPAAAAAVTAAAMGAHPGLRELQRAGFVVLTSLAALGANGAVAAGDADCLARIVAAMRARAADVETQRLGAHALSCICGNALAFRGGAAATAEVVAVLCAALSAFGSADVDVAQCVLRTFAFLDAGGLPAALPAVLAAMAAHAASTALQRDGCAVLWRTGGVTSSLASGARTSPEARVRAVVAALRAHGEADASLAVVALAALKTLAKANGNCSALLASAAAAAAAAVDAGGVEAVLRALQAHASVMDVQRYGCWALCHLCDDGSAAKKGRARAKDAGGAALVAAALATFPDSAVVFHAKAAQRLLLR